LADPKDRIQVYELVSDALADSQRGHYAESIQKLQQAEKAEKDSLPVHYLLALNYYRQSDFPAAVKEFKVALKLSPGLLAGQLLSGSFLHEIGDWDQAIVALRRTLELDPTNFSAAL